MVSFKYTTWGLFMPGNFIAFESFPMMLNVKLFVESLLMKMQVCFLFQTNLLPIIFLPKINKPEISKWNLLACLHTLYKISQLLGKILVKFWFRQCRKYCILQNYVKQKCFQFRDCFYGKTKTCTRTNVHQIFDLFD